MNADIDATVDTTIETKEICYHCGETIVPTSRYPLALDKDPQPNEDGHEKLFCCKGCLQVYQLIHAGGNSSYYTYRTEFAPTVDKDTGKMPYEVWDAEIAATEQGYKTASFLIQGIHCASCVWLNEQVLKQTPGIVSAEVHLATNRAYLTWDSTKINMRKISEVIASIGYIAIPVHKTKEEEAKKASRSMLTRLGVAGFFMGNIMLLSVSLYAGYFTYIDLASKDILQYISWAMATPVLFYSAGPFFKNAWHSLRQGFLSMDFLTAFALSLAYFYSVYVTVSGNGETYFDGICFVTFAILIGRMIETNFKARSLFYLENLGQSLPKSVHVLRSSRQQENNIQKSENNFYDMLDTRADGLASQDKPSQEEQENHPQANQDEIVLPVEKIQQDDIIVTYPGEIVAFDGILLKNDAEVDESMITGEYRPLTKKIGDKILSGSRCLAQALYLQVDSVAEESTLANIARLAEKNMNKMPDVQFLAERVSRYFITFVFAAGISTFLFWYFWQKSGADTAIIHTISLLIAACPCALNLSIPTAFIVALQKASSQGILVQGGPVLEMLHEVDVVALDKTGTATYGNMHVEQTFVSKHFASLNLSDLSEKDVQYIAAAVEKASGIHHPIAEAFVNLSADWEQENQDFEFGIKVEIFENIPGRGLKAKILYKKKLIEVLIGSEKLMEDFQAWSVKDFRKQEGFAQGSTPVYMAARLLTRNFSKEAKESQKENAPFVFAALFQLGDTVRPESTQVVRRLQAYGKEVVLLTGDEESTARKVAEQIGVNACVSQVSPAEKQEYISRLQEQGKKVAMIGDGMNDAVALARAEVGISFAGASEISVYSSDILLLSNSIKSLDYLFQLARVTRSRIRQNLTLSFLYNMFLLPLAFAGYIIPLVGAIAMSLSSIVVVVNSLRLYGFKGKQTV